MIILAIDPGPEQSGWIYLDDQTRRPRGSGIASNRSVLDLLADDLHQHVAIEAIASYGMAVGREVFQTCIWIGRFMQAAADPEAVQLVYRQKIKQALCHDTRATDANIRRALLDLYPGTGGGATPQIGTKSKPGPLYGITSHMWSALAVAIVSRGLEA